MEGVTTLALFKRIYYLGKHQDVDSKCVQIVHQN